ncbi:hypothetical protein BDF20DRAFT_883650 [Mycotypha africana]|uniref:uncharacterized protein n=1 Tax=Mycotypha africana TaxID=64632 RepID=UPI002301E20B|nr:uncharacterized protein BDF20DRAFT_883650 [Mycotypha africana]KAI8973696.1 hypothetical protein BDF20DRAFT_883650 [Mycotypha africana]
MPLVQYMLAFNKDFYKPQIVSIAKNDTLYEKHYSTLISTSPGSRQKPTGQHC